MKHLENAIFTNICLIYDNEGNILVQDRKKKTWPGLTLPGGHVEKNESFEIKSRRLSPVSEPLKIFRECQDVF